jgi:hypothetical protein
MPAIERASTSVPRKMTCRNWLDGQKQIRKNIDHPPQKIDYESMMHTALESVVDLADLAGWDYDDVDQRLIDFMKSRLVSR